MIEWELGPDMRRTGRWRRRQFYAIPGPAGIKGNDERLPSERKVCEWRNTRPTE